VERRLSFLFTFLALVIWWKRLCVKWERRRGGNRRHINCLHRLLGLLAPDFRSFVILFIYETFCFKSFSVFSFLISICCPLFCLDFYFYRFSWSNHIVFFCIFWTILYLFLYIFFLFFCLLICFPFICSCLFLFSLFQLFLFLL
jgi:hypothetical protein